VSLSQRRGDVGPRHAQASGATDQFHTFGFDGRGVGPDGFAFGHEFRALGVVAWVVLEDVAMDAVATADGLVATTSASCGRASWAFGPSGRSERGAPLHPQRDAGGSSTISPSVLSRPVAVVDGLWTPPVMMTSWP
jgi:hypothetical protein